MKSLEKLPRLDTHTHTRMHTHLLLGMILGEHRFLKAPVILL